jgi:hypothetical protein
MATTGKLVLCGNCDCLVCNCGLALDFEYNARSQFASTQLDEYRDQQGTHVLANPLAVHSESTNLSLAHLRKTGMALYVIFLCTSIGAQGAVCHPHQNQTGFETPEQCEAALWRDHSIEVLTSNRSTTQSGASTQAICVPVS